MKYRNLFFLPALAFWLAEARAAEPRAFTPVVRAGDRVASAPVLIGKFIIGPNNSPAQSQFCAFQTGPGSKVREKGQYVLELEGTGGKGQVRVFFRRVDKTEADYRASHAVGELTCSVNWGVQPADRPGAVKGIIEPTDRVGAQKGIIQSEERPGTLQGGIEPSDRPRTRSELGFRANAAVHAQGSAPSILLQMRGLDPPSPSQGAVSNCVMKLTLRAAK